MINDCLNKNMSFVEKYQPRKINEIYGQSDVKSRLKTFINLKNFPNLIFVGKSGVGKTTAAQVLARELLGDVGYDIGFKPYHAAKDSSLNSIKTEINRLIRIETPNEIPFYIIFIDEFDELLPSAQSLLRDYLDKNSHITKFILACNYLTNVMQPLIARCTDIQFDPISEKVITPYLKTICDKENINPDENVLEFIAEKADGSLRIALNNLQSYIKVGNGIKYVKLETVKKHISTKEFPDIRKIFRKAIIGDKDGYTSDLDNLYYSGITVKKMLGDALNNIEEISDDKDTKKHIVNQIGICSWRISQDNVNDLMQMRCLLYSLMS